jgi:hypothetical protein
MSWQNHILLSVHVFSLLIGLVAVCRFRSGRFDSFTKQAGLLLSEMRGRFEPWSYYLFRTAHSDKTF